MDGDDFTDKIDSSIDSGLDWLDTHAGALFGALGSALKGAFGVAAWILAVPPFYVTALLIGVLSWWLVGRRFGVFAVLGLLLCAFMGLWRETMDTLALVLTASALALLIAIPVGILAGFKPRLNNVLTPVLDMLQTLPPYIYLLPAVALMGFGPQTALAATVVVAIPPALRLTAHGIRLTPVNFLELGHASGTSPSQMFFKIRLPHAIPSIMAGVNQCLMIAFGMVVIAGIVGAGGLGSAIYGAIRTLDIGASINGAIAIVILTMIIDRVTEAAANKQRGA